jgi:hypothetical protein
MFDQKDHFKTFSHLSHPSSYESRQPTNTAISCKNLVCSSSSARTCLARCLALFNSLVVLPSPEVVLATGAIVVPGGIIVLLALGTTIEIFWINGELTKFYYLSSFYYLFYYLSSDVSSYYSNLS